MKHSPLSPHSPPEVRKRPRWVVVLAMFAALAGAACGDSSDPGATDAGPTEDTDKGDDVVVPLPEFQVEIQADPVSGNAPLSVDLDVQVTGSVYFAELTYAWVVDETVGYEGKEAQHTFYDPGTHTVVLSATFKAADGRTRVRSDELQIKVIGCADLAWEDNIVTMAPPTDVGPGDTVTLQRGTLINDGERIEDTFEVRVVLSLNELLDEDDTVVATWPVEGMDAGTTQTSELDFAGESFVVPEDMPDGNYFVFLVADGAEAVNECAEDNNLATSTNNIAVEQAVALKPDLTIDAITFPADLTLKQNDFIQYQFSLENIGEGEAEQFKLAFWLSTDQKLDPETDIPMFGGNDPGSTVQTMGVGQTIPFNKSFKIPVDLPDGQYWMIGQVDTQDQVLETNEDNNITISSNSFTMQFEEDKCFDASLDALTVAPLASYWNGTVTITADVSNPGTVDLPEGTEMRAYISLQPSLNPSSATQVGSWNLPMIPAKSSQVIEQVISIPNNIPVLDHYVGVIIDPATKVVECSEGNNAELFPQPVSISATANVDVAASNLQFHPSEAVAGETIKVSYDLTNTGSTSATSFKVAVVFSEDSNISAASAKNGTDLVVGQYIVPEVPAGGGVVRVETVEVPIALPHTVGTYWVGVVADIDGALKSDTNKNNNVTVAAETISVTGAQGGCFEDELETNNTSSTATPLATGLTGELGSCGNEDWYSVTVPAGHSLLVDMAVSETLSIDPVPWNVDLELLDGDLNVVDSSKNVGNAEDVHVFTVAEEGTYFLRVWGKAGTEAHYELDVTLLEPVEGIDLLVADVEALPPNLYPGGLLAVAWNEVNIGDQPASPHIARVWASKDNELDVTDLLVAEEAVPGVSPLTVAPRELAFQLPVDIGNGTWKFLVETDAEDDVAEVAEDNNVGRSDNVFLDATLTCEDDEYEPNNAPQIATDLDVSGGGPVLLQDITVCPKLDDWFAVDLVEGTSLTVTATYKHDTDKGLLAVELFDATGEALLLKAASPNTTKVTLPWVWRSGTYYIRVANQTVGNNSGPYEYSLSVVSGAGEPDSMCAADVFEDNNALGYPSGIGCGNQKATMCKGDVDAYRIELDAGDALEVTLTHQQSQLKMALYQDPTASPVASKSGNGSLNYTAAQAETVFLLVEPKSDPLGLSSFGYTLFMDGVAGIDLSVSDPSLLFDEVYQGEDALVDFALENTCIDASGAFETTLWLSSDEVLDEFDVPLSTVAVSGVVGHSTVDMSEKVTVPFSTEPGSYHVLVEADSSFAVEESNEDNNVSGVALSVAKLCLPDALEPNDVVYAGTLEPPLVAPPGATDLVLCPFELDWYAIEVPGGTKLTVSALFSQEEGDLDMRLYDPTYSTTIPVAQAQSKDDNETIVYDVAVGGTYYVRVNGYEGSSASYDLDILFE